MVGKIGHGGVYQVGSGLGESLGGNGPGVYGYGEYLGGYPGSDSQRGVFDDDGFVGFDSGFGESHQIGFGVWFAYFHVVGCHFAGGFEHAGVVMVEPVEQRALSRTGDQHGEYAVGHDALQHAVGSRHGGDIGEFVEMLPLDGIYLGALFVGGLPTEMFIEKIFDGTAAGTAFVQVKFVFFARYAHGCEGAIPGLDMIFHRIVENAVHIDEGGFGSNARYLVAGEVIFDSFIFQHGKSLVFYLAKVDVLRQFVKDEFVESLDLSFGYKRVITIFVKNLLDMKKLLRKWIPACALSVLVCACGSNVADGDYAGAFKEYVKSELKAGSWILSADKDLTPDRVDSIQVEVLHEVTVADSLRVGRQEAIDTYVSTEQQLKYEMEVAEHNYKLDENSLFVRRAEYARRWNEAKRTYGNDLNHASKINSYKEVMESLPENHEAYVKFDKNRDFSYIRKYEEAKAAYEQFVGVSVEEYIQSNEKLVQYAARDTAEVLGMVAQVEFITPDGYQSAVVLFNEVPTFVKAILTDSQALEADESEGDAVEYEVEE